MVLHHIFNRQMAVEGLKMTGQPIIGSAKIVALVLKPGAEIPLAGNEETMVVAEIVIVGIALAQPGFIAEIATQRINRLEGK